MLLSFPAMRETNEKICSEFTYQLNEDSIVIACVSLERFYKMQCDRVEKSRELVQLLPESLMIGGRRFE